MFYEWSYNLGELGATWSAEQRRIIDLIISIGRDRGEPLNVLRAALAAGYVESHFRNLSKGDRDSAGVMQQRPSQGWGTYAQVTDPVYAINKFYDEAGRRSQIADPGALAQAVQRSAFPARYGQALSITDPLLDVSSSQTSSTTSPPISTLPDEPASDSTLAPPPPAESSIAAPLALGLAAVAVAFALS